MKPILLRDWQGANPSGWLMSEKLDGWRMLWNGSEFISRQGLVFDAPDWFKAGMPAVALDGELFAGRGRFNSMQALMRDGWHGLSFQVFDAPAHGGDFRQRYASLLDLNLPAHCGVVEHVRCTGESHLMAFADGIVANGGEGAVIRDPKAKHEAGRSWTIQRWVPQDPVANRKSA